MTLKGLALGGGQLAFGLSGPPPLRVDVQSSANLSSWQLVTSFVLEGGTNYFVTPAQAQGNLFYRGHVP